jgi:hypothetical protein
VLESHELTDHPAGQASDPAHTGLLGAHRRLITSIPAARAAAAAPEATPLLFDPTALLLLFCCEVVGWDVTTCPRDCAPPAGLLPAWPASKRLSCSLKRWRWASCLRRANCMRAACKQKELRTLRYCSTYLTRCLLRCGHPPGVHHHCLLASPPYSAMRPVCILQLGTAPAP